jgi:molybdate transport system substrate-binding protein
MKTGSLITAASIGFLVLVGGGIELEAAEIKVLSATGLQTVMGDLRPKFERATGHTLAITFDTGGGVVKRIQGGETFDVIVSSRPGMDGFVKDGKVIANTVTVIARSGIGVAVRKGSPRPDISSPEVFKHTLLAAKSIAYSNPAGGGTSGTHFAKVLDRLGIANEMKSKTVHPIPPVVVGDLVAKGEAELGVHQFQELMPVAGIEIVGPLPGDLQDTIVYAAAMMGASEQPEASKALVNFLGMAEAALVMKAKGLEPVTP